METSPYYCIRSGNQCDGYLERATLGASEQARFPKNKIIGCFGQFSLITFISVLIVLSLLILLTNQYKTYILILLPFLGEVVALLCVQ